MSHVIPPSSHWSLLPFLSSRFSVSLSLTQSFSPPQLHPFSLFSSPSFPSLQRRRNRVTVTPEEHRNEDDKTGKGKQEGWQIFILPNEGKLQERYTKWKHKHIQKYIYIYYTTEADRLIPQQQLSSLLPWHLRITKTTMAHPDYHRRCPLWRRVSYGSVESTERQIFILFRTDGTLLIN